MRTKARDRAAAAAEAAALALVGAWASLQAREQERRARSTLRLHESGLDLGLLQRELLPRALFVLHAASCAAVVWALVLPRQLPKPLLELSRRERDAGVVVGCVLPALVMLSRLLVERHADQDTASFAFFYAWVSISIGVSLLVKVALFGSLAPSVVVLVDTILLPILFSAAQIEADSRWMLAASCRFIVGIVLFYGLKLLPQSFTIGEAALMAQGIGMCLFDLLLATADKLNQADIIDLPVSAMHSWVLFQVERSDYVYALQLGTLGALFVAVATIPLLKLYGSSKPSVIADPLPPRAAASFVLIAAAVVGGIVYPWSCFLLETWNPFGWLVVFILDEGYRRIGLIAYWLVCLLVLVPLFAVVTNKLQLRNIIARKLFHLLVVAMFVPAFFVDSSMLALSYGVALSVFVLVECVRALALPPFGRMIAEFMHSFIDHRDGGRVILTHTYLLLGCALPLWLAYSDSWSAELAVISNAGILALGVGDAMGAVVGSLIGRRKIFGSKTIEGTLAIFFSIVGASAILHFYCGLAWEANWVQVSLFAIGVFLTSLLEAATAQIDNLVLPLYLFTVFNLVACQHG